MGLLSNIEYECNQSIYGSWYLISKTIMNFISKKDNVHWISVNGFLEMIGGHCVLRNERTKKDE